MFAMPLEEWQINSDDLKCGFGSFKLGLKKGKFWLLKL
jgi:hypothetical protein